MTTQKIQKSPLSNIDYTNIIMENHKFIMVYRLFSHNITRYAHINPFNINLPLLYHGNTVQFPLEICFLSLVVKIQQLINTAL